MLRFWSRSRRSQNVYTGICRRCFNSLMAQMANRAGVGGRNGMTVPHSSERSPYHQREKRYRDHRAPNSLLLRHF
jgi:hypothetical protein